MTTTKNNEHKKLNFSSERDQSQACLNSAEHEKNQGRKVLNISNLGEDEERLMGYNRFSKKEYDPHLPNLNDFAERGAHVRCMGHG